MTKDADRWHPYETGGMLLGYEADNGEAVVTAIIGSGPNARHRRFRFAPDANYQQEALETHFMRTDGRETYLGDWHTHPLGRAAPSLLDKRTLARIAYTPSSRTTRPVMLILASKSGTWVPCAIRFLGCEQKFFLNRYSLVYPSPTIYIGYDSSTILD